MIVVHVTHALLRSESRDTSVYRAVDAVFGLVAPTFLFCVGASFAIAEKTLRASLRHRLSRAGALFVLGYAMHPSGLISFVKNRDVEALAIFLEADILQVIAIALALLAVLARVAPSRWPLVATALATIAVFVAPWTASLPKHALPIFLLPYFSRAVPTEFPIAPWIAFALFSASLLAAFGRDAIAKPRVMTALAIAALVDGLLFSARDPSHVLATFAIVAFAGLVLARIRLKNTADRALLLFGRRSLFLYVGHIAIVYARQPWSLASLVGARLDSWACAFASLAVVATMGVLAWIWDALARSRTRVTSSSARLPS